MRVFDGGKCRYGRIQKRRSFGFVTMSVALLALAAGTVRAAPDSGSDREGLLPEVSLPAVDDNPNDYIVGFETFPAGLEPGQTHEGAEVLRVTGPEYPSALFDASEAPGFVAAMREHPNVRYVEANEVVRFDVGSPGTPPAGTSGGDGEDDEEAVGGGAGRQPSDPDYWAQYGPELIGAEEAWRHSTGEAAQTSVCVIDTGARASHEDIRHLGAWIDYRNGASSAYDDNGHGTHVAGVATALMDNGKGIAGMAQVALQAAKVLRRDGTFYESDIDSIGDAIRWCADRHRDRVVVNMSFNAFDYFAQTPSKIADAIDYAYYTKGRLLVGSAGNDGPCSSCVAWPAKDPDVIAISNIDSTKTIYPGSSRGQSVELAAPGTSIYSAYHTGDSAYAWGTGTSQAAPHVAGALALAWGVPVNQGLTNAQLRGRAHRSAYDLGADGRDTSYGHGMVDAKCLITRTPYVPRNVDATRGPGNGEITITWDRPIRACGSTITNYRIFRAPKGSTAYDLVEEVDVSSSYTDTGLDAGATYKYKVWAVNAFGHSFGNEPAASATTYDTPSAPANPDAAAGPGDGEITVSWGPPADTGGRSVTGYRVYRSTTSGGTLSRVASLGSSARSWTDTGLGPDVTRYYRVAAVNSVGEGTRSSQVSATTFIVPPSAPTNPSAAPGSAPGEIDLTWQAPTHDGASPITAYHVYRSPVSGGPYSQVASLDDTARGWTDTSGIVGVTAYYRLAAENEAGIGTQSDEVCSKPHPSTGGC